MVEARDVVIVGGGFAGLSAAVALAEQGFRVAVLEGRPALGGRAYSFADPGSDDTVDNGQHVLLGCYRQTLAFLAKLGTRERLIVPRNLEIEMLEGPDRRAHLRSAPLPGPLHMAAGLMRYRLLTPRERLGVIRAGTRLMYLRRFDRPRLARMTVAELMESTGQRTAARRCFWYPLAIATLNEDPAIASAALLAEVMKRAFFSRRGDSAFLYPTVGLSELYCSAAREFIEKRQGVVACRAAVERFELEDGAISAVRLRDGRRLRAQNFIAAVPPEQLLRLLPEGAAGTPFFAPIAALQSSPIICVHLWLSREVTRSAFVGFIGTTTQWLFNKRRIFSQYGIRHPGYLSFVISGARNLIDLSNHQLLEIVLNDLRAMLPAARQAEVMRDLVLKEKHATIAPDAVSDAMRPPVETPLANLFLAGDWIQTRLPATIESAVVAGHAAAAAIATRVGGAN